MTVKDIELNRADEDWTALIIDGGAAGIVLGQEKYGRLCIEVGVNPIFMTRERKEPKSHALRLKLDHLTPKVLSEDVYYRCVSVKEISFLFVRVF